MITGKIAFSTAMTALTQFEYWANQNECLTDACSDSRKANDWATYWRVKAGQALKTLEECSKLNPDYKVPEVFVPDDVTTRAQEVVQKYYTGRTALGHPEEMCSDIGDVLVRYFAGEKDPEEALQFIADMETDYQQARERQKNNGH